MNVTFYHSGKPREVVVAEAFAAGVRSVGDRCELRMSAEYAGPLDATDVAVVIGVKGISRRCVEEHRAAGKGYVYIDKGYFKPRADKKDQCPNYYKTSVNSFQCLEYLMTEKKLPDRYEMLRGQYGFDPQPQRAGGAHVVVLGSSNKYTHFHGLGDATEYWKGVVTELRRHTDREIVYRPKHSWQYAVPIAGTRYSRPPRTLSEDLAGAWAAVTHGSNSSAAALLRGVPVITLGPAVVRPLCSISLDEIERPRFPSREDFLQWLYNVSHTQFTRAEMASGTAWKELRQHL